MRYVDAETGRVYTQAELSPYLEKGKVKIVGRQHVLKTSLEESVSDDLLILIIGKKI